MSKDEFDGPKKATGKIIIPMDDLRDSIIDLAKNPLDEGDDLKKRKHQSMMLPSDASTGESEEDVKKPAFKEFEDDERSNDRES